MEERTILGAGAQSLLEPGLEKAGFQSGKIGDQGYTDDDVLLASQEHGKGPEREEQEAGAGMNRYEGWRKKTA